ncbi:hypothetical protein M0804_007508 [Polistes exclamans]|nr:hypothetical protein M0804_007508 [Polistes exclamans]
MSSNPDKVGKTTCVVCLADYDEDWIQCSSCHGWAYEACADISECSEIYHKCDQCGMYKKCPVLVVRSEICPVLDRIRSPAGREATLCAVSSSSVPEFLDTER